MNDREELLYYWAPLSVIGAVMLAFAWVVEPARSWWSWGVACLVLSVPRAGYLFVRRRRR